MRFTYPILFFIAILLHFAIVLFISFNYIHAIGRPLLGTVVQIFPIFHFGILHNWLNNLLPNSILANQWAFMIGWACVLIGIVLILKGLFTKSLKSKHYFLFVCLSLIITYFFSQQQSFDYTSSYKSSYSYALGLFLMTFALFLNTQSKMLKLLFLFSSGFAFASFLGHHFVPHKHIAFLHFSFLPKFGALTVADTLVVFGLFTWGLCSFMLLLRKKRFIFLVILSLGIACKQKPKVEIIELKHPKSNAIKKTKTYNENKNVYFGDLHLHTNYSFDAYVEGRTEIYPDQAYQFAKGDTILLNTGEKAYRKRPLDFLAVTDHAEYLGVLSLTPKEALNKILENRPFFKYVEAANFEDNLVNVGRTLAEGTPMKGLFDKEKMSKAWNNTIMAANKHYQPGKFTTFIGYEWTSVLPVNPKYRVARNLHRNVIFGNDIIPTVPFSSFDSKDPEALWNWMDLLRNQGADVLAIPHNANISNGVMYGLKTMNAYDFDENYAKIRMRNEPISEIMQRKGQAMVHPMLSSEDEFANFHVDHFLFGNDPTYKVDKYKGSYMREALKDGIRLKHSIGANPFQYGIIGSTDLHNGLSNTNKEDYYGNPKASKDRANYRQSDEYESIKVPGGLAAVWAEENTRSAIFKALENKETYATSGSRIQVRFFAGWTFEDIIFKKNWVNIAYERGVPMGGDLANTSLNTAPTFLVWAAKDPDGANLDRIQIVKGWVDENLQTYEKVYNVIWSDAEDRVLDAKGDIPAIENTVNISKATYTNDYGNVTLQAIWRDPDFDAQQSAFYYMRVLEIPTPSAAAYDYKYLGKQIPVTLPKVVQERAWSSPIWYYPK